VLEVDGGEFVVQTTGFREAPIGADGIESTPPVQYVQTARLNGQPLTASYLSATEVHRGGVLHLELGPEPSSWGRDERPPSRSAVPGRRTVPAGDGAPGRTPVPTTDRTASKSGTTTAIDRTTSTDRASAEADLGIVIDVDGSSAGTGGTA
jgi:hypothetical protein